MLQPSRFYRLRSRFLALNDINGLLPLKSPFFFKRRDYARLLFTFCTLPQFRK